MRGARVRRPPDNPDDVMNDLVAAAARPLTYSEPVAGEVCARAAAGESEASICRDPAMPSPNTLRKWRRRLPGFAARYAEARAAGAPGPGGRPGAYCPALGRWICARVAGGEAMRTICGGPGMPGASTVYRWLADEPDFASAYRRAREIQAHDKFDAVWEIAKAATPTTASVARLQIAALTWQAAKLAPRRYGPRPEDGAEAGPQPYQVIIRQFGSDSDDD